MFINVRKSYRKLAKNVDKHVGTFWSVYTWVLDIENVGDDVWDQIYLDRWVPGYINASHPYGNPKTLGNPQKARITSENLGVLATGSSLVILTFFRFPRNSLQNYFLDTFLDPATFPSY